MDAPPPPSDMHAPAGFVTVPNPRRTELLLDALKAALAASGEHRLFRAGKLPGRSAAARILASISAMKRMPPALGRRARCTRRSR